jgi:excisionase family DNA binding protein
MTDSRFVVHLTADELRAIVRSEVDAAVASIQRSQPDEDFRTLSSAQVAKMLRVNQRVVSRWARRHVIPGKKIGGVWRFVREDVVRFLQSKEAA